MKFDEFGINRDLLDAISYMGFKEATPIQEQAIPEILAGKDLIACAQTGTGKTAAFLIPILDKLADQPRGKTTTLIIVPTRELAIQIDQHIQGVAYTMNIHSISIYGGGAGDNWEQQKRALTEGADIIVATPGKLISHLNMGYVKFDSIKYLILDEADRMLDIGFIDDLIKIISYIPKDRQTLMFSATMAPKIRSLATKILISPVEINISIAKPAEGILQAAYMVYDNQKTALVGHLVADKPDYQSILIFCATKRKVNEVARLLKRTEKNSEAISSDLEQKQREEVLLMFKARKTRILVATDVLSRGIDIKDINLIINYDVPQDAEDYVHRVGRTARADSTGLALTFISPGDINYFYKIEQLIEKEIYKIPLPPDIGTGPEWQIPKFNDRRGKKRYYRGKQNPHHKRR